MGNASISAIRVPSNAPTPVGVGVRHKACSAPSHLQVPMLTHCRKLQESQISLPVRTLTQVLPRELWPRRAPKKEKWELALSHMCGFCDQRLTQRCDLASHLRKNHMA